MELKVWVEGLERVVCGLTENTTCQETIYALAHATGKTGRFVLVEQWRSSERSLAPGERPLELLKKWDEHGKEVKFVLKCLEEGVPGRQLNPPLSPPKKEVVTADASAPISKPYFVANPPPQPLNHHANSNNSNSKTLYNSQSGMIPGNHHYPHPSSQQQTRTGHHQYNTGSLPRRIRVPPPSSSSGQLTAAAAAANQQQQYSSTAYSISNRVRIPQEPFEPGGAGGGSQTTETMSTSSPSTPENGHNNHRHSGGYNGSVHQGDYNNGRSGSQPPSQMLPAVVGNNEGRGGVFPSTSAVTLSQRHPHFINANNNSNNNNGSLNGSIRSYDSLGGGSTTQPNFGRIRKAQTRSVSSGAVSSHQKNRPPPPSYEDTLMRQSRLGAAESIDSPSSGRSGGGRPYQFPASKEQLIMMIRHHERTLKNQHDQMGLTDGKIQRLNISVQQQSSSSNDSTTTTATGGNGQPSAISAQEQQLLAERKKVLDALAPLRALSIDAQLTNARQLEQDLQSRLREVRQKSTEMDSQLQNAKNDIRALELQIKQCQNEEEAESLSSGIVSQQSDMSSPNTSQEDAASSASSSVELSQLSNQIESVEASIREKQAHLHDLATKLASSTAAASSSSNVGSVGAGPISPSAESTGENGDSNSAPGVWV